VIASKFPIVTEQSSSGWWNADFKSWYSN